MADPTELTRLEEIRPLHNALDYILTGGSGFTIAEVSLPGGLASAAIFFQSASATGDLHRAVGVVSAHDERGDLVRTVEDHRQIHESLEVRQPVGHVCAAGLCRRFDIELTQVKGLSGIERRFSTDRLAPYLAGVLVDTILVGGTAYGCDWLAPRNRRHPMFADLVRMSREGKMFGHQALSNLVRNRRSR